VNVDLLKKVLRSPEPKARAAATRVLAYWRDRVPEPLELLRAQVNDENGAVRLQAVWALSFFSGADAAKAAEVVVESLIYPQDDYLKHQLNETNKTLDRRAAAAKK
jgi:HEAT repeat protein